MTSSKIAVISKARIIRDIVARIIQLSAIVKRSLRLLVRSANVIGSLVIRPLRLLIRAIASIRSLPFATPRRVIVVVDDGLLHRSAASITAIAAK